MKRTNPTDAEPPLDASVQWRINSGQLSLEEPDYRSVVEAILSAGLATEVVGLISAGKEANVYLARYNGAPLAIKSYRLYRTSHRGGGPVKQDSMGRRAAHEHELMRQAWKGGVRLTEARAALESGLAALQVYFRRYDLRIDIAACANELVESLDRFGVLH